MQHAREFLVCFCIFVFGQSLSAQERPEQDTVFRIGVIEKIEIKTHRSRYKKQNNPAFDLAQKLVEKRSRNQVRNLGDMIYTRHEKIILSIDNYTPRDSTDKLFNLNSSIVLNPVSGNLVLPISLKERVMSSQIIDGVKREEELIKHSYGFDEQINQESVSSYLTTAMESTDIFADNISFMQRRFISPTSRMGLDFYRFYLVPDTVTIGTSRYVELLFYPANKEGLGLSGSLLVCADSTYFIKNVKISIPRSIDLNFIHNFSISLSYSPMPSGASLLESEDMNFNFSITERSTALNAQRSNQYVGYDFVSKSSPHSTEHVPPNLSRLTESQIEKVNNITQTMRKNPLYRISEVLLEIATQAYVGAGPYFDIGPVFNFISSNELEGVSLSFGAMTTPALVKRLFAEAYVGYGTRDQRWKYSGALEWSFIDRKEHLREFPIHSLRLSYIDGINKFGAPLGENSADNIFSWLKRTADSALTYVRRAELTYMRENQSHLSYSITARHFTESASRVMNFGPSISHYTMSELEAKIRYAPGEVIFQTKRRRYNMERYSPIFELSHTTAIKNFLGSSFSTNRTKVSISNRFNLQPFGYLDVSLGGTAQWECVPYMFLPHPGVNLSYVVRDGSFSLMRPLEFLYDKSASWDISYYMDGLIFSRLPLIKKLKLREVFTFRGVWGNLSNKNNPNINHSLIPLPSISSPIGHEPYMEIGVGIDNILSLFRVDYVWRLSYREANSVIKGGVLVGVKFKF